jgi:succinate dehydrogenase/fumarate reductase flavoprotein subunit
MDWKKVAHKGLKIGNRSLNSSVFADDLVSVFYKEERLQRAMFQLNEIRKDYNMKTSTRKRGHSGNCAATYNIELRQLSLFHGTISHVLRH